MAGYPIQGACAACALSGKPQSTPTINLRVPHLHRCASAQRLRWELTPPPTTPKAVKPPQPNISSNSLIPLIKKLQPLCILIPANAHTRAISLRSAPTGPSSQAFSLQETRAMPAFLPVQYVRYAAGLYPPLPPLQYFSFPHFLCMFSPYRFRSGFAFLHRTSHRASASPLSLIRARQEGPRFHARANLLHLGR